MSPGSAAGNAQKRAPGVHIPIRGAQSGKRRHKADAAGVLHSLCQLVRFLGSLDEFQFIPQPLDCRPGVEGASFQCVSDTAIYFPSHCGQKARFRSHRLIACVHQHKAACAICIFRHTLLETALAEQGRVLVSRHARDGDFLAQHIGAAYAHDLSGFRHPGQGALGNAQLF